MEQVSAQSELERRSYNFTEQARLAGQHKSEHTKQFMWGDLPSFEVLIVEIC